MEASKSNQYLVPLACFIQDWLIQRAAGVFTVTREIKSFLVARSRQPESKFHVISNGCDVELCLAGLKIPRNNGAGGHNIGFLGSFEHWQGVETVIKALPLISKDIPDVRFQIGGRGKLENDYRQLSKTIGVDPLVSFHGLVPENQVLDFVNRCRVMVVPRIKDFDRDTILAHVGASPIKLFTALGAGRPVAISRLNTFSHLVDCPAVFFADPDNPGDWADTLLHLLKMPAARVNDLSLKAIEFIRQHYTWDVLAEKTAHIMAREVGQRQ